MKINGTCRKKIVEIEQSAEETILGDYWRTKFHLYPPIGWLNDPNGLCHSSGYFHIFFQYSPMDANGVGEKFWGHYRSTNLIHWEYTGVSIAPDTVWDKDGAYSGSAFCENDKIYLYYTGNVKQPGEHDYIYTGREANTLLITTEDGITMSNKNILMSNKDYPVDMSCHVRDPKVWKENNIYYMVQGARSKDDEGMILVFTSNDREHWRFHSKINDKKSFGYMWECPDLFTISHKRIISFSPQGVEEQQHKFQNVYQSGYCFFYGDFTEQSENDYELSNFEEWDKGFDFYAPQTFEDMNGRRILIGWMGIPDAEYTNPTVERGWQHVLTIPRELKLSGDGKKILQNPVKEMQDLRQESFVWSGSWEGYCKAQSEFLIDDLNNQKFLFTINQQLELHYDPEKSVFSMSFKGNMGSGRKVRTVLLENGLQHIQILIDTSAIEVFLNHGETVMSTRYYPEEGEILVSCKLSCGKGIAYKLEGMRIDILKKE